MITRKKMRWEIAKLEANNAYLSLENELLETDNDALISEVKMLREKTATLEAEKKALLEAATMLCDKATALTKQVREQKLKIMSLEALWNAKRRNEEDAKSA